MSHGADVNYRTIVGENARSIAVKRGHDRLLKYMGGGGAANRRGSKTVLDGPAKLAEKLAKHKLEQEKRQEGDAELKSFLAQAGLEEKYHDLFAEKKMTLGQLMDMDDAALKEIGLTLMGPRRKLTSAIARRKAADQLSATTN